MDSLSRALEGLSGEIRALRQQTEYLRDSLDRLEQAALAQESAVAALDSQYRILEAERQPLLGTLAGAIRLKARLSRWAMLDALLGSSGVEDLLRRRAAMRRLEDVTLERARHSAELLSDLQALKEQGRAETARLGELSTNIGNLLETTLQHEQDLLQRRDLALTRRELLIKKQNIVEQSDKLLTQQLLQTVTAFDTVAQVVTGQTAPEQTSGFLSLRGRLPWPIEGFVASRFGKSRHRKLATVTENPGVDLQVESGVPVRAVASGTVTTVTWLRGFGNLCIVQHDGEHHTVYARLGEVLVKQDDVIDKSTIIGYPGFDPEHNRHALHFEVWSGKEKQDPLTWLAPAKTHR